MAFRLPLTQQINGAINLMNSPYQNLNTNSKMNSFVQINNKENSLAIPALPSQHQQLSPLKNLGSEPLG